MGAKIIATLIFLLTVVQGLPSYEDYSNDQYDYEYEDDELPINEEESQDTNVHRPSIVSTPVMLDVDNGMTIRLPCLVDKLPGSVQIIWSKEDAKSTQIAIGTTVVAREYMDRASVTVDEQGSTLYIGIAKSEDAGKYKCSVAVRGDQPEQSHEVRIRAPPSVDLSTPSLLEPSKGDDVTLSCKASGKPRPQVRWSRVGKMMPDGQSEIKSEVVTFSQVSRKHSGTYRCTASNGHGKEATQTVEVVVKYAPEIELSEMFIHTREGEEKTELVCNVHAHPAPQVIWERNGQKIIDNSRVKQSNIGSRHTLVITSVQRSDFGSYSCRASNNLGTQHRVIELSGHASPAEFKSQASGNKKTTFLLEWTSKSYSPISKFLLDVAQEGTEDWRSFEATFHKEGPYHWAGKQFLSDLDEATQYKARVRAENSEGWGQFGEEWHFATHGAVPSPVTGAGVSVHTSVSSLIILISVCLFRVRI